MPPKARSCHQQRHQGGGAQIQRTRQEQFDGSGAQNPCQRAGGELLEGKLYQILEDQLQEFETPCGCEGLKLDLFIYLSKGAIREGELGSMCSID